MEPVSDFGLTNITGFIVTHYIFIALNSFLILNLLIAVFSDSVSFVNSNSETLLVIQKLSFAVSFADSFSQIIFRQFFKRNNKYFIQEGENTYLHVRVLSPMLKPAVCESSNVCRKPDHK